MKLFWFAKSIYHCECRFIKVDRLSRCSSFFPFSLCSSCFPCLVLKCLCLSCLWLIVCLWPWRSPLHFTRSTLLLLTAPANSPVPHHFIRLHCIWSLVLQKPSLDRSVDMCGTSSQASLLLAQVFCFFIFLTFLISPLLQAPLCLPAYCVFTESLIAWPPLIHLHNLLCLNGVTINSLQPDHLSLCSASWSKQLQDR